MNMISHLFLQKKKGRKKAENSKKKIQAAECYRQTIRAEFDGTAPPALPAPGEGALPAFEPREEQPNANAGPSFQTNTPIQQDEKGERMAEE
jgi:hypothetical protein